jgi:tetratricopeptide (TPR) repeat protein
MAELAVGRGRYLRALEQVERALAMNASDSRGGDLTVTLLRILGRLEEAEGMARQSLAADPLDFWAANELQKILAARGLEEDADELTYFQGLSWKRLGRDLDAQRCFERLVRLAREKLEKSPAMDYFAKFGEKESAQRRQANLHFLLGLGLRGLGKDAEAKAEFEKALKLYPHFSRVRRQLQ